MDGSSNKIIGGLQIKEIATDNFLLFPPDKVPAILFLKGNKFISSIRAFIISFIFSFFAPLINP